MPTIDPAIARAPHVDAGTAHISAHGGSGFASTYRITTATTSIFVKQSRSPGADVMFQGEHASLNAIHDAVPSLCPRSYAWAPLERGGGGYFLATEYLDFGGRLSSSRARSGSGSGSGRGMSLAQKLARLHTTPAPVPDGYDSAQFGFPVPTCCGDTPQDNTFTSTWAEFFGQRRLLAILDKAEQNNGRDPDLRRVVERAVHEVVPKLLGSGHLGGKDGIAPVVVHGDLWAGNKSQGRFVGRGGDHDHDDAAGLTEDVVFDPSSCYAHNEYDFGIMHMFGGYSSSFWKEYHALVPKTEPVSEYEDRVSLYESYHHLNHYAIFGGSYKSGAVGILKKLVRKYGEH